MVQKLARTYNLTGYTDTRNCVEDHPRVIRYLKVTVKDNGDEELNSSEIAVTVDGNPTVGDSTNFIANEGPGELEKASLTRESGNIFSGEFVEIIGYVPDESNVVNF